MQRGNGVFRSGSYRLFKEKLKFMASQHELDAAALLVATALTFAQENPSWVSVATPAQQRVLIALVFVCSDDSAAASAAPHERWVFVYTVNGEKQATLRTNRHVDPP